MDRIHQCELRCIVLHLKLVLNPFEKYNLIRRQNPYIAKEIREHLFKSDCKVPFPRNQQKIRALVYQYHEGTHLILSFVVSYCIILRNTTYFVIANHKREDLSSILGNGQRHLKNRIFQISLTITKDNMYLLLTQSSLLW